MSLVSNEVNRRRLLGMLGVAGAGATASAFAPQVPFQDASVSLASGNEHSGHDAMPPASNQDAKMTADEMDAMHEAGIKIVPGRDRRATAGSRSSPRWMATSRSSISPAMSCSGSTRRASWSRPGPTTASCRVRRSASPRATRCASMSRNNLPESTAIHLHGLMVPNNHGRRAVHHAAADQARPDASPTSSRSARATPARTCTTRTTTRPSRSRRACWARSSSSRRTRRRGRRSTSNTRWSSTTARSAASRSMARASRPRSR